MKVLVAGELNADLIFSGFDSLPQPGREVLAKDFSLELGSSSAICAAGLARLGTPVSFLGKIGADVLGRFCIDELARMGVDATLVQVNPGLRTGITGSFSVEDRALVTFAGAIAELTCAEIPSSLLSGFTHLHVSSYYLQRGLQPGLPGLFQTAKRLGLTVSLDPGHDPAEQWGSLAEALTYCDVLFLNEVELAGLAASTDVIEGLRAVSNGRTMVVAKLGKRGCAALASGRYYAADAISVDCVDTTGAGDSFNAGFLHAWLRGFPLESCLDCGSICGGLSTRKLGGCAGQAGWPEVEQIMQDSGRYPLVTGDHGRY
jgi:sugar/nucleoside kinase (ribokinase family)